MWYHNGSQCILRVPQFFAAKFIISGGSKGGGSQFHTFFGNFDKIVCWRLILWGILDPPMTSEWIFLFDMNSVMY